MKPSLLQALHVVMLSLSGLWAALCLATPPVEDGMFVTMAVGPLVSYAIGVLLIAQLRRDRTAL